MSRTARAIVIGAPAPAPEARTFTLVTPVPGWTTRWPGARVAFATR